MLTPRRLHRGGYELGEGGGHVPIRPVESNAGVGDRDHAAPEGMTDRQTDRQTHTHDPSII